VAVAARVVCRRHAGPFRQLSGHDVGNQPLRGEPVSLERLPAGRPNGDQSEGRTR
jgi:hypothetical protein